MADKDDYARRHRRGERGVAAYRPSDGELEARSRERGVTWRTPVGARDKFSRNVMALVARSGDFVKSLIAEDKELAQDYWASLRKGVKQNDRTAMHLYTKILKLVDEEKTVVVTVLHQLGMSSMEELERLVQTHKEAGSTTPEQKAAVCLDYLELYYNAHPEERSRAVLRLGGEVRVTSDSFAEEAK